MPHLASSSNDEAKEGDVDCYKLFECAYLVALYGALTILYLSASTILQFLFLWSVSIVLIVERCRRCGESMAGWVERKK